MSNNLKQLSFSNGYWDEIWFFINKTFPEGRLHLFGFLKKIENII